MEHPFRFLALVAAFTAFSPVYQEYPQVYIYEGESGKWIGGVSLKIQQGKRLWHCRTNGLGEWDTGKLPEGEYEVTPSLYGWEFTPKRGKIQVKNGGGGLSFSGRKKG